MIMGDICGPTRPDGFSPVCTSVRQLAERVLKNLDGVSAARKAHGPAVAEKIDGYFQGLSPRVEHGPGMNRLVASTAVLTHVHHLALYQKDKARLDEFMAALGRGMPLIPNFEAGMGLPPAVFCGDIDKYVRQYQTVFSDRYILGGSKMLDFIHLIGGGGLELPPLLALMAFFALPIEEIRRAFPKGEEISEDRMKVWSDQIRGTLFPLADMIGWQNGADNMRHNAVLWHPDLKDKLDEKEIWLAENEATLDAAATLLQKISDSAIEKVIGGDQGKYSNAAYEKDGPSKKTAAAMVVKEEDKPGKPVMDLVRTRYILHCDGETVQSLGYDLIDSLKNSGAFRDLKIQDNYRKPKPSGYRAIHITGFLMNGLGIPVEIILIDEHNYENAACGRTTSNGDEEQNPENAAGGRTASRAMYKMFNGRASQEDADKFAAVANLLKPVLQAALELSKIAQPARQLSLGIREDEAIYTVHRSGVCKPFKLRRGITALDAMVKFYSLAGQPIRNAEVYEGEGTRGRKLGSFFEECPPVVTIVPGDKLSYGTIKLALDNPRVLDETKKALRKANEKPSRK